MLKVKLTYVKDRIARDYPIESSFKGLNGSPYDNEQLSDALNKKLDKTEFDEKYKNLFKMEGYTLYMNNE